VGDLEFKKIGKNSVVWTEQGNLEEAAHDFSETDQFLSAAIETCGGYVWGKYDILVLPPSFPYGGMENPTLTFVTPALLSGDRANADVIAHEIAHSWTGNLVSNLNWEHFWLNEGFTMWVERKIIQRVHGKQVAHLSMILGWQDLLDSIEDQAAHPELTKLWLDLKGVDPDDAFSSVPYEKGFNFLFYLENLIGEENFSVLFKNWIQKYARITATSQDWKQFFLENAKDKVDPKILASIDWETWLRGNGLPPVINKFDESLHNQCIKLADQWKAGGEGCTADQIKNWPPIQVQVFLDRVRSAEKPLSGEVAEKLNQCYKLSQSRNVEIQFRFFMIAIKSELKAYLPDILKFVTSHGRMKYVRPIYRSLTSSQMGKEHATSTFVQSRGFYHNICATMVAKDLGLPQ